MTRNKSNVFKDVHWIALVALLSTGKVWAQGDIPPLDPDKSVAGVILGILRNLWDLLTGLIC